jgi:putative Mg2+ transporter-C (MgtC) family protein
MGFLSELQHGLLSGDELARVVVRLLTAAVVGAIAGVNRERTGKAAGLRTHMLVAIGAAVFVLAGVESGVQTAGLASVIQGVAAGIGFIGAGAILKSTEGREVFGLTTASGIWMTAAAGAAAGLGHLMLGLLASLLGWIVLGLIARLERAMGVEESHKA